MDHHFCHACGSRYAKLDWPRSCPCGQRTWRPTSVVVVALLPVQDEGLLLIRRGDDPGKGKIALPGGHYEWGEDLDRAVAREVEEEVGLILDPADFSFFRAATSSKGELILFLDGPAVSPDDLRHFQPNREVTELVVLREPAETAFPTHTATVEAWFDRMRPAA